EALPLTSSQPSLPWGSTLWPYLVGEDVIDQRDIPVTFSGRKDMAQDVQFAVERTRLHAPETFGAVRAHHACGHIAEGHEGQSMPQQRIERKRLSVGPSLARHHLVAVAAHDVGQRYAPERPVGLRSILVGLKFLFTRPKERIGFQLERTRNWR